MKRRNFVKTISLSSVAAPFLLKDLKFQAIGKELFRTKEKSAEDKVLIIIRLGGGNDGLNTVIPLDHYANLTLQRSNIMLPESNLLTLTDTIALHPSMTGMQALFNEGKMGIVQNVGYPDQNRSHFRSTDIWNSGLMEPSASTGWLGRDFDTHFPNFPMDYPNPTHQDPFAISMGSQISATCQGLMGNFSHTVNNPLDTFSLTETGVLNDGTYYGSQMEYLATIIEQTNAYGSQVNGAVNNGQTLSTLYDETNPLAVQLRYIAQMISGGLKTKVYILNIDGFDTHDSQVTSTDVMLGKHSELLKQLSDAVHAFQDDLTLLNLDQRVAGMTYSEFGRQIASNASLGTDHGDAAPLFLFGTCIGQLVVGQNPVIDNQIVNQQGVQMEIDFRDVYASVLKNWFEIPENEVQMLFEHPVTFYGFLNGCSVGLGQNEMDQSQTLIYPNPVVNHATIRFASRSEFVRIEIFDLNGKSIKVIYEGFLEEGLHDIPCHVQELSGGAYTVLLQKEAGIESIKWMKMKGI
jgi:uncharacterized protein (DUF1501 family)